LHAPLQQSASAVQVAPLGLQAASRQPGVDLVAAPCSGVKAVTVLSGDCSTSSRSHAAAGKATTPTKSAKKIGEITRALMITSLDDSILLIGKQSMRRHWTFQNGGATRKTVGNS
jgi:hypothetical protein